MNRLIPLLAGLLATVAILGAHFLPFATVPIAGTLRLGETTWGGGGRLWAAAAVIAAAAILYRHPRLSILLAGVCLGLLIDVGVSGWQWRAEKLELLNAFGAGALAKSIQWKSGALTLCASYLFVLAFVCLPFYPVRPAAAGIRREH